MRLQLQTDEVLAATVQAYPCLYDKSDPGYRDNLRKQNAWNALEMRFVMMEPRLITFSVFVFF